MPEAFDKCVKDGGRVRTKLLSKGKYIHICYDKSGSHPGYVKTKKGKGLKEALSNAHSSNYKRK